MKLAVVVDTQHRLPALGVLAVYLAFFPRGLRTSTFRILEVTFLPEIETFSRVNLRADCLLKVFVRDSSVPIGIELTEQLLKLFICDISETPMLQVESKLLWLNCTRFLDV